MIYNIDFEIAAAVFLALYYVFLKFMYTSQSKSDGVFRIMVLAALFMDLGDMISAMTISYYDKVPVIVNIIINEIYYIATTVTAYMLPNYMRYMFDEDGKRDLGDNINDTLVCILVLFFVINPFTKLAFYFDENNAYHHGVAFFSIYIGPIYYQIYALVKILVCRKKMRPRQFNSILFFVMVSVSGTVLQFVTASVLGLNVLIVPFATAVGMLILIFTLETLDYKVMLRTLNDLEDARNDAITARDRAKKAFYERNEFFKVISRNLSEWSLEIVAIGNGILESDSNPENHPYVERMLEDGERINQMSEDIGCYLDIQMENLKVQREKYLLKDLMDRIYKFADEDSVEVNSHIPSELRGDIRFVELIIRDLMQASFDIYGNKKLLIDFRRGRSKRIDLILRVRDEMGYMSDVFSGNAESVDSFCLSVSVAVAKILGGNARASKDTQGVDHFNLIVPQYSVRGL